MARSCQRPNILEMIAPETLPWRSASQLLSNLSSIFLLFAAAKAASALRISLSAACMCSKFFISLSFEHKIFLWETATAERSRRISLFSCLVLPKFLAGKLDFLHQGRWRFKSLERKCPIPNERTFPSWNLIAVLFRKNSFYWRSTRPSYCVDTKPSLFQQVWSKGTNVHFCS